MGSKLKILVADDNPNIRETLTSILADKGYSVATVKNGYEVIEYLKKYPTNILILDLMMPEKDGLEILSSVATFVPKTKIIIYTAFAKYENSIYAMIADKFVVKGDSPEKLLEAIKAVKDVS